MAEPWKGRVVGAKAKSRGARKKETRKNKNVGEQKGARESRLAGAFYFRGRADWFRAARPVYG
jgi:hypothetical protein